MSLNDQLHAALKEKFPQADISLNFDGKLLSINISSEQFKGLSKVKQHQLVYKAIEPWVLNQEVHAVKIFSSY